MTQVNIAEAKARFSELVRKALAGEDVIVAKDNKPLLRLVPVRTRAGKSRRPGSAKGQMWMAADFHAPLEDFSGYR